MKFAIVALAFIGFCSAAVDPKDAEATIVDGSEKVAEYFIPTGYDYKFKTSNDIEKSEIADLGKNIVTEKFVSSSKDVHYQISLPLRKTIKVTYQAGAGIGFFPRSEEIPSAIIDAIELNLKNPPEDSEKKR
ncbi:hypothetical protein PVAND_011005 [Polypedilum vanderplanki]|uniref:Uncharacterized protein n=1 Tax=Polypedilum vanderplanki TaxID=319348 RepID=A0A9J6CI18_POLVA|nr:hypothetical protein PVAND_011005 [Polypedilum vanderplanki]